VRVTMRTAVAAAAVFAALTASARADAPPADTVCGLAGSAVPTREAAVWSVSAQFTCRSTAEGGIDDACIVTGALVFRPTLNAERSELSVEMTAELTHGSVHVDGDGQATSEGGAISAATRGILRGETGAYLGYLAVWEATITAVEDPELTEIALGGHVTVRRVRPHNDDR